MITSDVIIVGGGPVGCVLAEKISSNLKLNCLIIEKRSHIGGNCYDEYNSKGLLYHKYGPHYLRFKNRKTMNYLSKFTEWLPGYYIVKSSINKKLYPMPINLTTLEMFFGRKFKTKKEVLNFLDKRKVKINNPKNFEEFVLSKLGKDIYDNFYKNYTIKQWNIHPSKLSKEIAGRLPIRFNRDPYYVKEKLRYMPKKGFTEMFKNMTANKRIKIKFNSDFFKIRKKLKFNHFMIYTGEPDRYFDFKFGKLDWRSLIFKFQNFKKNKVQKCVQYNFPNDFKYTRSVEIKHVTKQRSKFTVISKEYPTSRGEPDYPMSNKKNIKLFEKYKKLIAKEMSKNIFFEGRLAKYKYFNTDEVIESALSLFNSLKKKYKHNL